MCVNCGLPAPDFSNRSSITGLAYDARDFSGGAVGVLMRNFFGLASYLSCRSPGLSRKQNGFVWVFEGRQDILRNLID